MSFNVDKHPTRKKKKKRKTETARVKKWLSIQKDNGSSIPFIWGVKYSQIYKIKNRKGGDQRLVGSRENGKLLIQRHKAYVR